MCDVWLLNDKRPGGTLPAANMMFYDDQDPISRRNRLTDAGIEAVNINRLMTLKHAKFTLDGPASVENPRYKVFKWYVETDIRTVYDGTSTAVSGIASNNLLLAHRAFVPIRGGSWDNTDGTGTAESPKITWECDLKFVDD